MGSFAGPALAVIFAGVLHATWNAIAKGAADRHASFALIGTAQFLVCVPALLVVAPPAAAAWPWLVASTALHVLYMMLLIKSYELGDFGQVYPLARGSAPLLVALVGVTVLGERLTWQQFAGVAAVCAGLAVLAFASGTRPAANPQAADTRSSAARNGDAGDANARDADVRDGHVRDANARDGHARDTHARDGHVQDANARDGGVADGGVADGGRVGTQRRAVVAALLTGVTIATYTVLDGVGVRYSGGAVGYGVWMFAFEGPLTVCWLLAVRRRALLTAMRVQWAAGLAGGVISMAGYTIVLWAQTRGTLAAVAALRETGVISGAVIGAVFFAERMGVRRIAAACAVALGVVLLTALR